MSLDKSKRVLMVVGAFTTLIAASWAFAIATLRFLDEQLEDW